MLSHKSATFEGRSEVCATALPAPDIDGGETRELESWGCGWLLSLLAVTTFEAAQSAYPFTDMVEHEGLKWHESPIAWEKGVVPWCCASVLSERRSKDYSSIMPWSWQIRSNTAICTLYGVKPFSLLLMLPAVG